MKLNLLYRYVYEINIQYNNILSISNMVAFLGPTNQYFCLYLTIYTNIINLRSENNSIA